MSPERGHAGGDRCNPDGKSDAQQILARFDFPPAFPANLNPRYPALLFTPVGTFTAGTRQAPVTMVRDDQANKFAGQELRCCLTAVLRRAEASSMGRKSRAQIMAEAREKPVTITQGELETLIANAVKTAAPQIIDHYKREILSSASDASPTGDAKDFMDKLALSIAELNDQGANRKRVAPEILMQRAKAHEKMVIRLEAMWAAGKKPRYRLIAKTYLNEQLIEPWRRDPTSKQAIPQRITWDGIPNEAMAPINDEAKEIHALYRESIGSTEKVQGPARRAYLTSRGLVIEGTAPAPRRMVGEDVLPANEFENDLSVDANGWNPNAPQINILGTIAPAAKQNVGNTPQVQILS
jgi:hypothetical protein